MNLEQQIAKINRAAATGNLRSLSRIGKPPHHVLSKAKQDEIKDRLLHGESGRKIEAEMGVARNTVQRYRKIWAL